MAQLILSLPCLPVYLLTETVYRHRVFSILVNKMFANKNADC